MLVSPLTSKLLELMARKKSRLPALHGGSPNVLVRNLPQPDGSTAIQIELRLTDLEVPDREYFADTASVYEQSGTIRLAFGQASPKGTLLSRVVIVLAHDSARLFLASCGGFLGIVEKYLKARGVEPAELVPPFDDEPAQHTATMLANVVSANQVGREATVDFYRLPAATLRKAALGSGHAEIEPIVRITLMTELLFSIINALAKIVPPGDISEEIT